MVKLRYKAGDKSGTYSDLMLSVRFGDRQKMPENFLENSVMEEIETTFKPLQGVGKRSLVGDLARTAINAKDRAQRIGADEVVISFIGMDPHTVGREKYKGEAEITYIRYPQA